MQGCRGRLIAAGVAVAVAVAIATLPAATSAQKSEGAPKQPAAAGATRATEAKKREAARDRKRPRLTIEQQNAVALLESLAEKARDLDDDSTRVMVVTRIADAIWPRDPERARKIYRNAFDAIEDIDEASDGSGAPIGTRTQLRAEILESLYRVDPDYAAKLAQSLDDDVDSIESFGMPFPTGSERGAALLRAAAMLAPANPALAASLARESLGHGVPFDFSSMLATISRSNRQIADELANDAVTSAARYAETPVDLWGIAAYVFPHLASAVALDDAASFSGSPDPQLARRFLAVAYAVTTKFASTTLVEAASGERAADDAFATRDVAGSYALASQLAPYFDQYASERAAGFRAALGQLERSLPAEYVNRYGALAEERTPEALVDRADAEPNADLRQALYIRAAFAAAERGDYPLAKSIVEKIPDEATREGLMTPLASNVAFEAADRKRYDEARKIALDVPDLEARSRVYTRIALVAMRDNDRSRAVEALDEAERLLMKADVVASPEKASALVNVANTFATIDAIRGFEVLRTAVEVVNKSRQRADDSQASGDDAAAIRRTMLDAKWRLSSFDASPGLERLARTDYFRALSIAQSYDDASLAILGQLAVIRGVLREPPAPAKKTGAGVAARQPDQAAPARQ